MARLFWMFGAWLACLLLAGPAAAEPRTVDVVVAGPPERAEPVERAIREPLSRMPVEVHLTRAERVDPKAVIDGAAGADAAFARVWVDLAADPQATLYFVDAAWERILVRRFPIERGLDDVEREEIAQIVRSAVEALLAGATIGISREQARAELLPPQPPPERRPRSARPPERDVPRPARPAPSRTPPPRFLAEVGGFYEAEVYAGGLWHGPGLLAGVALRDELSPGGRLTLQYRAPMLLEGERFGVRLQALALRALAHLAWVRHGFVLAASAGGGADLTHVDPTRVSGTVDTASASWDVVPVARVSGAAGLALWGIRVTCLAGADYDLVVTRHVAESSGGRYTVIETPRLRPFFGLELTVAIDTPE